jgi:putative Ca2+/H+ antiporter (TMEM165/GDT1 family)
MALWSIFLTVFLAEFGDKTQIAMLLFAADQHLSRVGVFLASAGALVLSSLLAVVMGGQVARYVDARVLKGVAGTGFLAIGLWLLLELRMG